MQRSPGKIAKERPNQPTGAETGEGGKAERHHGVQGYDPHDGVLEGWVGGQRRDRGCCGGDGAEDGGGEGVAPARGAELKKVFQSRDWEGEVVEELEAMSEAVADVEAWRQSEGVKNEEGVVCGLLLLDKVGREEDGWRARDDACRFGAKG